MPSQASLAVYFFRVVFSSDRYAEFCDGDDLSGCNRTPFSGAERTGAPICRHADLMGIIKESEDRSIYSGPAEVNCSNLTARKEPVAIACLERRLFRRTYRSVESRAFLSSSTGIPLSY